MKTIVLIGAGQLGSRHLQSLALLDSNVLIQVVDPFTKSLDIAKERFEQMPKNLKIKVEYFTRIEQINNEIDLCIIATTADIRAEIIKKIVENKNIKKFILEKVLFQKLSDLEEIEELLESKNIDCWVNHPFRYYDVYKNLKQYFPSELAVTYHVTGGDWGLACNGLHYLDHLLFLTNSSELKIDISYLDRDIIESKRKGFVEFTGKITGTMDHNNFVLQNDKYFSPLTITIQNANIKIILDEVAGWLKIAKKENNWEWENIEEKIMYFQSELTNVVVKDIFEKNDCDLPRYKIAKKLHKPFLEALLTHLNLIKDKRETICPIT